MGTLHFLPHKESTSLDRLPKTYVYDFYCYAKFGRNPSIGGYWANR